MAEVFMLDGTFIASEREKIKQSIAYARYKVGSTWYQGKIEKVEVLSDGRIEAIFLIDHTVGGTITITEVELCDCNGKRIGSRTVSIVRKNVTEGILYVCRFTVLQIVKAENGNGEYNAL